MIDPTDFDAVARTLAAAGSTVGAAEAHGCLCGAATGRYLDDQATVEQSEGTLSIALHNHDLRDAVAAYDEHADAWHPLMVFRAYLNPRSEPDVRFVPAAPPPTP